MIALATEERTLLGPDRCDRCTAQARVRVTLMVQVVDDLNEPLDLDFCGHHYAQHEPALATVVVRVIDERHLIP